ncbi:hypothetical protein [uncultured Chryseobacterium sp.]|uniref:hypothetical protein n=1 Tax=uncultured Chryseobacterium sp. TaxID=259322 RepID=UPI0025E20C21|nr:hypothetical protein [uncultured Chryseobacterium sp.]
METNFNSIEATRKIERILDQLAKKDYAENIGNRKWTKYIVQELSNLGKAYGFLRCPCPDDLNAAWLYDLVWYKNNNESYLAEIPFIMESEWSYGYDDIRYDFEKLLQADAKLKLMICCHKNGEKDIKYFEEYFPKAIISYIQQNPNCIYMIAVLKDYHEFEFKYYYYNANGEIINMN